MIKKVLLPFTLLFVVFVGSVYASSKYFGRKNDSAAALSLIPSPAAHFSPTPTIPSLPGIYNILLLGQGDPSHEGSKLTDSLMVVTIDTTKKTASLIFIPRDFWIASSTSTNKIKINEAYSLGGLDLAKQTVSTLTDLPIQYSILIDFNHFVQVIDLLGGIDINISKTFDDYYYPIAGKELDNCEKSPEDLAAINATMSGFLLEKQYICRYEHLHFDAGKTHVDGATALKFARSRHSDQDGNDFGRGLRQQAILIGIKNKIVSLDTLKNLEKMHEAISTMVTTDLDLNSLLAVSSLIANPKEYQTKQAVISEDNVLKHTTNSKGQYILVPKAGEDDFSEIQKLINNLAL